MTMPIMTSVVIMGRRMNNSAMFMTILVRTQRHSRNPSEGCKVSNGQKQPTCRAHFLACHSSPTPCHCLHGLQALFDLHLGAGIKQELPISHNGLTRAQPLLNDGISLISGTC